MLGACCPRRTRGRTRTEASCQFFLLFFRIIAYSIVLGLSELKNKESEWFAASSRSGHASTPTRSTPSSGKSWEGWTRCRASRRFVQSFPNTFFYLLEKLFSRNAESVQEETGKGDKLINDFQFMRAEVRLSSFFVTVSKVVFEKNKKGTI